MYNPGTLDTFKFFTRSILFFSLLQWNNTLGKHCCVSLTGRETEAQESWALPKDIDLALCNNQIKARTSGFSAWNRAPLQPPLELCTFLASCVLGGFPAVKGVINPNCFPDCQLLIAPAKCLISPNLSSALLFVKHLNFLSSFPWGSVRFPTYYREAIGYMAARTNPLKDFQSFPSLVISPG